MVNFGAGNDEDDGDVDDGGGPCLLAVMLRPLLWAAICCERLSGLEIGCNWICLLFKLNRDAPPPTTPTTAP